MSLRAKIEFALIFDSIRQAACYGRAFVPAGGFPRDGIVGVVRRLRLLNAMREPSVSLCAYTYNTAKLPCCTRFLGALQAPVSTKSALQQWPSILQGAQ